MPIVTLPDGSQRRFDSAVTVAEVAAEIGPGLAKSAVAGKINGQLVDTSTTISEDVALTLLTSKDEEGLEVIRHSGAHLLAQAVKQLFPEAQVTIGPVIDDGFYYDFAYKRPFTPDDLTAIEKRMQELVKQNIPVVRQEMSRDDAVKYFDGLGEHYKVQVIEAIDQNETLSLYSQGDFTDLCRGPHVASTGQIKAFKLMKVSGAYWRGDSNNEMLQRIYGTAWGDKKALKEHLHRLEEAEKRDHRKIAKAQDLFHQQEEAPGMVFWHEKGWTIYQNLVSYVREKLKKQGYQEVHTPQIVDSSLWVRSGHEGKYKENMFLTSSENREFIIKPMNCPCHMQIFNQGLRSYRDLPVRMAEFGCCHRNEPSGGLHGLMRVRSMVQDDGHIFCREDQICDEVAQFASQVFETYQDFGFEKAGIEVKLALRPDQRIGDDEMWEHAEQKLATALESAGIAFESLPGEGAFYGPKIEFHLRDCLNRRWQCGTIQLDYIMPQRLDATYIDENSQRCHPVVLHRAMLGSLERFMGILIEHYAGILPTWLAPVQVVVMNITSAQAEFSTEIAENLQKLGFRARLDLRNEKIGFKIREHTLQRVPYLLVIGDREVESRTLAVRSLQGEDLGSMSFDDFAEYLSKDVKYRSQSHLGG
ncbi:Threonine--tRNA ligase [Piscirickettsia salmonis]|uniref:Threonine--tRNA ligase n=2 Tax=Gammaproteobacteria TaxID=1236 RepID=A0A9Q6PRV7_PISSA|nr:threonine--tRNA ligase [Piscirickettsia salmonis]QGN93914.1 Threonine--tRNA ligase [Piscirickettsia salmonis]QGO04857.1 Threonine--tRNA ligase [Piscirickettsia salmonis]QGO33178.1 Threonine--tRNA ligase [Piscirickettsia salmonis]QGO36790.1 Threonine--tRNA ligase [Piscirickettsia salmonis]QGO40414.1 Threonine--tRNA ligase [Piscirickettsia salmonis]